MKGKSIPTANDIDIKWPSENLVESIGFRTKAGNRIKDYLNDHGILKLSLRELIEPAHKLKIDQNKLQNCRSNILNLVNVL
ncbi:hypothetical protein D1AOALGA4SA_27 [Olavius algarvensis Delta 1 endosymbiont]|nr:hypothetical protein D1AOALGA4SA_27 [Olavius algarvensis Delta 1 endosymbiont]